MTKFKHRQTGLQQLWHRIPFGVVFLVIMFAFTAVASLDARGGEPVDAYGMVWDSELLADYEASKIAAQESLDRIEWMIDHASDTLLVMAEVNRLVAIVAEGVAYWSVTKTVNQVDDAMCDPVPEDEDTPDYNNHDMNTIRYYSA